MTQGLTELIRFDRPLRGATVRGPASRLFTAAEVLEREAEARRQGADEARAAAQAEIGTLRTELETLQAGVLAKLGQAETMLLDQLRDALPPLALDLAKRLLAGYEPDAAAIGRICAEALAEVFPERTNLELALCGRDAALLEKLNPDWLQKYPGLSVRADPALAPGDCVVRSRFGLIDARLATKLAALEQNLTAA